MNQLDAGKPLSNREDACSEFQRILVFYVPEAELQMEKQYEWLQNVQLILSNHRSGTKGESNACIHATWLGPGSSDRLVELIKGAARVPKNVTELPAGGLIPFNIRSMLPTISSSILNELSDCKKGSGVGTRFCLPLCESSKMHSPQPSSIQVIRGPCDDEDLSDALVDELRLRRPKLFHGNGQVVLLSEWDTLYGRALPISFKKAFKRSGPPTNIREFTYLRGLDGQISGIVEKPAAKAAKSTELPDLAKDLLKSRAPSVAYGRTQVDYVSRLAKQLRQQLDEQPGKANVEAVGILGSDTYDKLLILQAMRDAFPGAQFFTTELDAVLSDPDQYAITRNLLIASGFGLGLAPDYQRRIMPFRDAHQTAFYFATLRSVRELETIHKCRTSSEDGDSWSPVLYEVGRNGPCALPSVKPSRQAFVKSAVAGNYVRVKSGWVAAILTLAMTLGVLAICMTLNFGRAPLRATRSMLLRYVKQCRQHGVKRISAMQVKRSLLICLADAPVWFFVFSVIFLIGVAVAIPITAGRPDQEPLFLSEGISSWPATWLRALAVFLAACYFWNLTTSFRRSLYAMRRTFREALGPAGAGQELAGPRLYSAEFRKRSLGNRFKFIVIAAFAGYMILAYGLFHWLGYPAPTCRGDTSRKIEQFVLFGAVCSSNLLMCYAIVHNLSCASFLRRVAKWFRTKPDWEKEAPLTPTVITQAVNSISEVMGRMVYYPFTLVFVLIVARQSLFDNFDWPIALIVVLFTNSLFLLITTLVMREGAGRVREEALKALRSEIDSIDEANLGKDPEPDKKIRKARAEWHFGNIHKLEGAVFAQGITANPAFRALLIPLGGTGALQAIDLISKLV